MFIKRWQEEVLINNNKKIENKTSKKVILKKQT
jgi:hypothetical protein